MKPDPTPVPYGRGVLVVEDEPRLRSMLERAVRDMGFDVTLASTGEAALKIMETQTIGIIILDLNLPGIDGIEFLEKIRRRNRKAQAIILTGFGNLETAKKAIHLDVVEFLTKPCSLGTLEVAIDRARRRCIADGPSEAWRDQPQERETPAPRPAADAPSPTALSLEELEQRHILAVLEQNRGNRAATATQLGISLRKLYYRLGQYQRQGIIP
ncbi:MAG: sigma-54 dependent transcriptional regulator/response regulator [Phycisphaerales bacterium]|nr:sigma-54 dependent transcriptional regulator/response regulator [Phycisphaerales bacterium]MDB5303620.1 sigma-54 dependent transcriptional regulator/response regulator [Phycisphaerales bacterium]